MLAEPRGHGLTTLVGCPPLQTVREVSFPPVHLVVVRCFGPGRAGWALFSEESRSPFFGHQVLLPSWDLLPSCGTGQTALFACFFLPPRVLQDTFPAVHV